LLEFDAVMIFLPKETFWPLDDCNIAIKPLMGKPIFMHLLEAITSSLKIRRLKILHFGDIDTKQLEKSYLVIKNIEIECLNKEECDLLEVIKDSFSDKPLIAFSACDLGILEGDDPIESLMENTIYFDEITNRLVGFRLMAKTPQILPKIMHIANSWKNRIFYPWDFLSIIPKILRRQIRRSFISKQAEISANVNIVGPCYIAEDVRIFENATIKGPCYIGRGTIVGNNVLVRQSVIEEKSIIGAFMEVARSWLGKNSETHSGYIGDTIFSEKVHTGAGFITANVRLDRGRVKARWFGKKIDTGLCKFGAIIGANVEIGIHSGTMPGVLIGKNARIGPGTLIFENVPDNAVVYAKRQIEMRSS